MAGKPGEADPQPGTGTEPPPDPAATGAGAATGSGATGADAGRVFSQEDLDAIVLARTAQARRTAADAAEKARQWDAYQASQQTEQEKADTKRKAEEARLAEVTARTNARAIAAEVRLEAVKKGVREEALVIVARMLAGAEGIVVGDDGEVTGVEAALNELLKDNKYLLADKTAPIKNGSDFTGETPATHAARIKEAEAAKDPKASIALKMAGG